MQEVYIIDAIRTPIGRYNGILRNIRPDDLAALVLQQLAQRNANIPLEQIDDVVFGNVNNAGEDNRNVARMATLLAGYPQEVSATTINRLCGSSLDAISYAARAIKSGEAHIVIAGGVESMTRAPFVMAKPEQDFPRGSLEMFDTTIGWRFINPKLEAMYGAESMPQTAENIAQRLHISKERQNAFAASSQQKAQQAIAQRKFEQEIMPITTKNAHYEDVTYTQDENPRQHVTVDSLAHVPPLFDNGTVTAANASGINDGAAALLFVSGDIVDKFKLQPIAKYSGSATAGVEPAVMGLGPIASTKKLLHQLALNVDDFDLVELNEAFAVQAIACMDGLGLDEQRVNVNGGAIALGHPIGASGARIMTTLIYELQRRGAKRGLATMCIGVGQGISVAIEAPDK